MSKLAADDVLNYVIDAAKRHGASASDALLISGRSTSVKVRLGETEQVKQSRDKGVGVRVFVGQRSASTSSSDLDSEALDTLVARTVAAARVTAEDPFAGMPDAALYDEALVTGLDLYDPDVDTLDADRALGIARAAEAAALDADPRLTKSEGAEMGWGDSELRFASSQGAYRQRRSSSASFWTTPIAEHDGKMERDYWYSSSRHLAALESPEAVGREAARRTLRRLGARKPATTTCPVIFEAPVATRLVGTLAGAINGSALYKDASYLCGKLGERVASALVTIVDDPHIVRGAGSRTFDAEGLATRKTTLVEDGILKSYILDTYSGKKLGMASTRGARRGLTGAPSPGTSNLWMTPGDVTLEDLIKDVERGLLVTETFGFGVSTVTGDFSQGATGIWIENGALAYPVTEFTIASKLDAMYNHIDGVANDRDPRRATSAPSFRVAQMTIAGS